jgi:hypothetical protein
MIGLPLVLSMLGCDATGAFMSKFIPALEFMNEEWAPITMECDTMYPSRKPKRCITATLKCGDTIRGNNKMGRSNWDDTFYRRATCFAISKPGGHSGPEMVYKIKVPPHTNAIASLKSDCVDLDVFTLRWNDKDLVCPKEAHAARVGECQADQSPRGGSRATMSATQREETYLIAVDGKGAAVGNFELTIECRNF